MEKNILLDVDGVVADFWKRIIEIFKLDLTEETWPKGMYDLSTLCGKPTDEVWDKINNYPFFWQTLDPIAIGFDMHRRLVSKGFDITFLTAPCREETCPEQKIEWLTKYFGKDMKVIIDRDKYEYVHEGILIDDSDKQVDKFLEYGGKAILYPQPWNSNYKFSKQKIYYVETELEKLFAD